MTHSPTQRVFRVTHRGLLIVVALIAGVTLLGGATLRAGSGSQQAGLSQTAQGAQAPPELSGKILAVTPLPTPPDESGFLAPGAIDVEVVVRLDDGEVVIISAIDETGAMFAPGQAVKIAVASAPGTPLTYAIVDYQRATPLILLSVLFIAAVVAFGRWQGLRALIGLTVTAGVILWFLVPAILAGRDPVITALTAAFGIMLVTLYLSHGTSAKTTAAVVGTSLALVLTGLLALAFVDLANLTGLTSEDVQFVRFQLDSPLSLRGLLLAGVILGGLGVLDDVTVAQSSTVFELKRADPAAGFAALTKGAMAVGRDHVAATVNTLFLAYVGAALPLVILFTTGTNPLGTVLTSEIVAVEIVRTLVGSLGLIAAVPITTALAAALAVHDPDLVVAEPAGHSHRH